MIIFTHKNKQLFKKFKQSLINTIVLMIFKTQEHSNIGNKLKLIYKDTIITVLKPCKLKSIK